MDNKNNVLARLEAMLFACGDPVEASRLADVLEIGRASCRERV